MRQDFAALGASFDRWLVTDEAIAAHASGLKVHHTLTTTRRLLKFRDYELATLDLRRLLSRPSQDLLPATTGPSSYVIDCERSDDGEIYAHVAALEPTSA